MPVVYDKKHWAVEDNIMISIRVMVCEGPLFNWEKEWKNILESSPWVKLSSFLQKLPAFDGRM